MRTAVFMRSFRTQSSVRDKYEVRGGSVANDRTSTPTFSPFSLLPTTSSLPHAEVKYSMHPIPYDDRPCGTAAGSSIRIQKVSALAQADGCVGEVQPLSP